jgi:outer membrane protein
MRFIGALALLLQALFLNSYVWAQSNAANTGVQQASSFEIRKEPATERLDLARCIAYALQNNNRSKVSKDSIEMALGIQKQALSSLWPQISGRIMGARMDEDPNFVFPASAIPIPTSTFSTPASTIKLPANSLGPGFPPTDVSVPIPSQTINIPALLIQVPKQDIKIMNRDSLAASANVTFPLYTGGLRSSRIKQARSGLEAARQEARRTDLEVIYDVKRLYYGGVLAHQLVAIGSDTLARMEATLDLTEKLYTTGSGTVKKTDYLRTKAIVETLRSMVAEIEEKEKVVQAALVAVMGMDWKGTIELADREVPSADFDFDVTQVVDLALQINPELAKVEAGIKAAAAGVGAARSGRYPKVGLFANTSRISNSYDTGMVTPENKVNWSVGLGIDIPIFQGFRVTGEEREAQANLEKLQHQRALLRDGIAMEVKNTCSSLMKARQQKKSTDGAFKAAVENRELNTRAYQEELVETKEVIEAQLLEAALAGQYWKARYDQMESRAKLDFLIAKESGQPAPAGKQSP